MDRLSVGEYLIFLEAIAYAHYSGNELLIVFQEECEPILLQAEEAQSTWEYLHKWRNEQLIQSEIKRVKGI